MEHVRKKHSDDNRMKREVEAGKEEEYEPE